MKALAILFSVLGALGLFLIGMRLLSEGLQRVANDRLRSLMRALTGRPLRGIGTGFALTTMVQSSAATTIMVVSFVTAGLLTLSQALGVIMGANIGTTMTGWLVAVMGFQFDLKVLAMPLIAIGVGLSFFKALGLKDIGGVLVGLGVVLLGLVLLQQAMPQVPDPATLAWVEQWTSRGFASVLLFVVIGAILTTLLQSSSATLTFTMALAVAGWLPFTMAAAMVLGENIGTTVAPNLAAIGKSLDARRAARAHLLFNLAGVIWALLLLDWALLPLTDLLVPGNPHFEPLALQGDGELRASASMIIAVHLAAFHTLFNLLNTGLFYALRAKLEAFVCAWLPDDPAPSAPTRFLSQSLVTIPSAIVIQAREEMRYMASLVIKLYEQSTDRLRDVQQGRITEVSELQASEQIINQLEATIIDRLSEAARGSLGEANSRAISQMILNTHRLEQIADHCLAIVGIFENSSWRFKEGTAISTLEQEVRRSLELLLAYLDGSVDGDALGAHLNQVRTELTQQELEQRTQILAAHEGLGRELAVLDLVHLYSEIVDRVSGFVTIEESRQMSLLELRRVYRQQNPKPLR